MRRVILGTAGHIDHGKTTLVKALTGTDTDRLPEEKARGITIDLGFAQLQLDGLNVGIVDVPGHEGLIRNMLAGATGFDAVLLVVAADEGIMPQTREHFAIAELLGIERLVVALTKADTVDADWLDLVRTDVTEFLAETRFADAPVIATSATHNLGMTELRDALQQELSKAAQRRINDVFRMPIDRVFTVHGTGTVVTGTVWSGSAARDDVARILPGLGSVRIRAVQTHGAAVDRGRAGERAAFALAGVDRADVTRGHVLVQGDAWEETTIITARVGLIGGTELKHRQRVRVHLGTAEVMARAVLLSSDWIQLRLEQPIITRAGDRFVLRSYSPLATIGGGSVAEIGRARKRLADHEVAALTELVDGSAAQRLRAAVQLAGEPGCPGVSLAIMTGVAPEVVEETLAALADDVARIGSRCFSTSVVQAVIDRLVDLVHRHHEARPLKQGIERAELLGQLPAALAEAGLLEAERRGALKRIGSLVAAADFAPSFSPAQQALRAQLLDTLRAAGLAPPTVPELAHAFKSNDVRPLLRLLENEGAVTAVAMDLYLDSMALSEAVHNLRASLAERRLPAAEFRSALPVSRKYLIPLLEYLDRVGVTRREGDLRYVLPLERAETA